MKKIVMDADGLSRDSQQFRPYANQFFFDVVPWGFVIFAGFPQRFGQGFAIYFAIRRQRLEYVLGDYVFSTASDSLGFRDSDGIPENQISP